MKGKNLEEVKIYVFRGERLELGVNVEYLMKWQSWMSATGNRFW